MWALSNYSYFLINQDFLLFLAQNSKDSINNPVLDSNNEELKPSFNLRLLSINSKATLSTSFLVEISTPAAF